MVFERNVSTASKPVRRPAEQQRGTLSEIVQIVRARLHATLALVKSAQIMPWEDQLSIIREDNAFRFSKDVLPSAEGAALWTEFNKEMDRLYAIMNQGMEPDLGD